MYFQREKNHEYNKEPEIEMTNMDNMQAHLREFRSTSIIEVNESDADHVDAAIPSSAPMSNTVILSNQSNSSKLAEELYDVKSNVNSDEGVTTCTTTGTNY